MFPSTFQVFVLDARSVETTILRGQNMQIYHSDVNKSIGLVHFTDPQSMDYHEWTTETDYLNGRLSGIPKWTTQLFLYAAGQLFYRRIHSSRVMADTLGGE